MQFDTHLKTKRSVELFLTDAEKRIWVAKIGNQMLAAAEKDTRAGQREARRANESAASADAPATADAADAADATDAADAAGGKKPKRRTSMQLLEEPEALPALADGKFLQIDLDCKLKALSHKLLSMHHAHAREVAEYCVELTRAERLATKQREMEAARQVLLYGSEGAPAAEPPTIEQAASGVADLSALGEFASLVRPRPPARIRIMLTETELVALIVEALLATADRISQNRPIDAHRSMNGAGNRKY